LLKGDLFVPFVSRRFGLLHRLDHATCDSRCVRKLTTINHEGNKYEALNIYHDAVVTEKKIILYNF